MAMKSRYKGYANGIETLKKSAAAKQKAAAQKSILKKLQMYKTEGRRA